MPIYLENRHFFDQKFVGVNIFLHFCLLKLVYLRFPGMGDHCFKSD